MSEEKKKLTQEAPSTPLRAGKIKKAKELLKQVQDLELTEKELEKVAGGWMLNGHRIRQKVDER